jgi:hypothetical protein
LNKNSSLTNTSAYFASASVTRKKVYDYLAMWTNKLECLFLQIFKV